MQYKKIINSEIEFTRSFKLLAQAYEEIAVMKMRKVRSSVINTRDYLEKLSEVFYEIKKAQKRELLEGQKKIKERKAKGLPIVPSDKKQTPAKILKTVSVFVSANTTLYGDLISRIFTQFVQKTSSEDTDIIIIGRVGRRLYDQYEGKKPYLYFEFPDVEITLNDLKPVIFHLIKYQNIIVYYGKFENIVNQQVMVSNVSGREPFANLPTQAQKQEGQLGMDFLFEPSLEAILVFFQDLIASSLFRQTVRETQLARLGSRIMSMEKAQQNVDDKIKKLHFLEIKLHRQEEHKKQQNRLSGISLWLK